MSQRLKSYRAELPSVPQPTNAGRQLVDEYLDEQRMRILREAARNRGPDKSSRIGAEEVQLAITRINAADRLILESTFEVIGNLIRRPRFLRFAALLAITASLATIAMTLLLTTSDRGTPQAVAALSGVSIGIAAGALGATLGLVGAEFATTRMAQRRLEASWASRDLVQAMAVLEGQILLVASILALGDESRRINLRAALRTLVDRGLWSEQDEQSYLRLLHIRNALVHEDALRMPKSELAFAMSEPKRLRDPLDNWLTEHRAGESYRRSAT